MSTPAGSFASLDALTVPAPEAPAPQSQIFESSGIGPQISFLTKDVQPPSPLYVSLTDRLQFTVWNDVPFIELDFVGRLLEPDGSLKQIFFAVKPPTGNAAQFFYLNLAEGFMLSFSVTTPTPGVTRGQCFVNVALVRGSVAQPLYSQALVQEYVSLNQAAVWPAGRIVSPLEGPGNFKSFHQTNLAGVNPITVGVNANRRWRIISASMIFVTDGVVANRVPNIVIKDVLGNVLWAQGPRAFQPASTTREFHWGRAVAPAADVSGNEVGSLPDGLELDSGGSFIWQVGAAGFDPGDTIAEVDLYYEQLISP
jgi:hypothetical protein